ncbi:MAG: DUF4388 domain-containing protein [Acidimicrobiales bacterium]
MALDGTFETFSVMDVVGWLQQLIRVGRLDSEGANGEVHLWVADGGIVAEQSDAHGDNITPAVALFDILRAGPARWQFVSGEQATSTIEHAPVGVMSLVGDLEAMVTEWAEILDVVPSADATVRLVSDPDGPVTVNDDRWGLVLLLADGPATVGELVHFIGTHDLAGRRRLADLVEAGIATVDGGPPSTDHMGVIDLTEDEVVEVDQASA